MSAAYLAGIIAVLLALAARNAVGGIRLYKSRADALLMLGEKESRIYFYSCEQSSNTASCAFSIDAGVSPEPTQCARTNNEDRPWWMAFLDTPAYITTVTVLNMDQQFRAFMDALTNMTIMVADDVCFRYAGKEAFMKRTFPCDAIGDQITIQSELSNSVLTICDVEVLGVPLKFPTALEDDKVLNVGTCQQSGVEGNGHCTKAFDGDTTAGSCSATTGDVGQFLEVSLDIPSIVNKILIFSVANGGGLTNFTLTLNNRKCTSYAGDVFESRAFDCQYFGDTLRITSELPLSMTVCEIQLHGHPAALGQPAKFKYLGCNKDVADNRDLTQLVSSTAMSPNKCYRMCKRAGVKYFGLQAGRHCFCGAAFGKHGQAEDSQCSAKCEANDAPNCGGALANSMYEIV